MVLTVERLRTLLRYDTETGNFIWRCSRRGIAGGRIAGSVSRALGYRLINVDGKKYYAHRLAWLYTMGEWPPEQIDHINGNRDDNRRCNLRAATESQNKCNTPRRRNNCCGYKGVHFHKETGKWRARIKFRGLICELGLHDTATLAHSAYVHAAHRLHGEFARAV